MKKIYLFLVAIMMLAKVAVAETTDIKIKTGAVLVYAVKEGSKAFTYTVTVKNWKENNTPIVFAWQTDEKPKPRKGIITLQKNYNLASDTYLTGIGNTGAQLLSQTESFILPPALFIDYLFDEEYALDFIVKENGKPITIAASQGETEDFEKRELEYNGKTIISYYTKVLFKVENIEFGLVQEIGSYKKILAFYRSPLLTINLLSITTNVEIKAKSKISIPAPLEKKAEVEKMDAVKFAAVKKAFPLLATIENYDVTNGGTNPKPFGETYDYRQSQGDVNPPTAIDCFTADLQILYNQRKNFDLSGMPENISKTNMPAASAAMLLHIYLKKDVNIIPGYKTWTHYKFVNSLTETQRSRLAIELEGYIKQYGFIN